MDILSFILLLGGVLYYKTNSGWLAHHSENINDSIQYKTKINYTALMYVLSSVLFYFGASLFIYMLNVPKKLYVFDTNLILIFTAIISVLHIVSMIMLMVSENDFSLSLFYGICYALLICVTAVYTLMSPETLTSPATLMSLAHKH